jgi:hypothetical protein
MGLFDKPEPIRCANPNCAKHFERHGGEFVYSLERKAFFCKDCFHVPMVWNEGENRWHFTTTHFNGERIEVKSLAHLRSLEKQYGCSSHAANYDQKNWSTPPPVRPMPVDRELMDRMNGRNYS